MNTNCVHIQPRFTCAKIKTLLLVFQNDYLPSIKMHARDRFCWYDRSFKHSTPVPSLIPKWLIEDVNTVIFFSYYYCFCFSFSLLISLFLFLMQWRIQGGYWGCNPPLWKMGNECYVWMLCIKITVLILIFCCWTAHKMQEIAFQSIRNQKFSERSMPPDAPGGVNPLFKNNPGSAPVMLGFCLWLNETIFYRRTLKVRRIKRSNAMLMN